MTSKSAVIFGLVALLVLAAACRPAAPSTTGPATSTQPSTSNTLPTSTPTGTGVLSQFELEYQLFDKYPDFFWCDPDFFPIGREGQEEENSLEQFPDIRANESEFAAILDRLGLPLKNDYTDREKLEIYREHKKLTRAIQVSPSDKGYAYTVRVGEGEGFTIQGEVSRTGQIREMSRTSSINTCPICLAEGTVIDTPAGPIPVEKLRVGMKVWTVGSSRQRLMADIILNGSTSVPTHFSVIRITVADGRTLTASPGHPLADGRRIGGLRIGDNLEGEEVTASDIVAYGGRRTWDILPSGPTGFYWAGGVLVASTLANNR